MMKNMFRIVLLTCTIAVLSGCASMKEMVVTKVEIPLPIPCNIIAPQKPSMPYTDEALSGDEFTDTKRALAEIEVRKGYESILEAAIKACNTK